MVDAMLHRGPDHNAVFCDGPVGLGYTRLAIFDLSESGNQPMFDESGDWVAVYNGEVYNFAELRAELEAQGVHFRSRCDTEVVVNLFARLGPAALARFNGMFGLAVWSRRQRRLWVARDPLGVKPLYYRITANRITFSSEMKSIHRAEPDLPGLSARGILNYLAFGHAISPDTIFNGIRKVPPGYYLEICGDQIRLERYFEYPSPETVGTRAGEAAEARRSESSWIEECDSVLGAAVQRQMAADVPVGVFLSGGIDSGLVTAYMARHSRQVHAFSIGFSGQDRYNEVDSAAAVARHLGAQHHQILIGENDLVRSLDKMVYHFDEPFGDAAGLPVFLLSQYAVGSVRVALSGEGGDEMFGGYRRYLAEKYGFWNLLPAVMRRAISLMNSRLGRARRTRTILRSLSAADPAARYAEMMALFSKHALEALVGGSLEQAAQRYNHAEPYAALFEKYSGAPVVSRLATTDAQTWLADTYLEKVDKMSMAVSLEVRVPMLDLEVVRFSARCPDALKVRGITTKYILRRLAEQVLPKGLASMPKRGLAVPTDPWFRGQLKGFVRDSLLGGRLVSEGLLRREAVSGILERHANGRENCQGQIWTLLVFEQWAQRLPNRLSIAQ